MTSMSNATMGGNMTGSENMTNSSFPMVINSSYKQTLSLSSTFLNPLFCYRLLVTADSIFNYRYF